MDWKKEYKIETGLRTKKDNYNYFDNYVKWLENKLTEAVNNNMPPAT